MATQGIELIVTHGGLSSDSLLIADVDIYDGVVGRGAYVPRWSNPPTNSVAGYIELVFAGDVAKSFESGYLRNWITSGAVTVAFVVGGVVQSAVAGWDSAASTAGITALVVDKGTPGTCYVAMDDGAGTTQTPLANSTYIFSINGVALTTLTAKAAAATEDEFTIGASGTTAALALKNAINAHSVIGLRLTASLMGADAVGLRYVVVATKLAADLDGGYQATCALNAGTAGVTVARSTAIAAGKYAMRHVRYVVNAQDMFLAAGQGEVALDLGFTSIAWANVRVLTSATNSLQVAWTGKYVVAGGVLTVDNSGVTDFAAGNLIEATIYGTVA